MTDSLSYALCGAVFLALASAAHAGPAEDLGAKLQGRTGTATHDRTHKEVVLKLFGQDVKGGCQGDVLSATVRITAATGHLSGDTAAMDASYDGSYQRTPCGSDAGTPETKHLSGHYLFQVTSKPFQKLAISDGVLAPGFGEAADANDPSNRLAVEALKNAVDGAF